MELFDGLSIRWSASAVAVAGCLATGLLLAGQPYDFAALTALIAYLLIAARNGNAALRRLADRLDSALGMATEGPPDARLGSAIASLTQGAEATADRLDQRHSMTGLPTREPLLLAMAGDGRGVLGVVRLIDFDRLSAFDPALGEQVLGSISERLVRMLPASRLVAHVDRANLAIWFGPAVDEAAARTAMDAIGYALSGSIQHGDSAILPEIRVRLAVWEASAGSAQSALAKTLALLAMKSDEVSVAVQPAIDPVTVARDRYALEQDLRQAIARGEFQMHYQPLIDAGEGRVCGAEALIRWHNPERGNVPPSLFVPIMETIGLAHEIGMWAMNAAAREAHSWHVQGLAGLRVAVNLSGHQLDRDDLAALVERTLARHALGPDALEIELTETVAMGDGDRAARLFAGLRAMGVKIAIDDFGTGYSSFSTLRTLAFDKIKIDREFVSNVDSQGDSQAICQSILALGRGLGIRVLAEGVERRAEYEWLRRHGCTHFQGFYFSPPLASECFADFVRDTSGLAAKLAIGPRAARQQIIERLTA